MPLPDLSGIADAAAAVLDAKAITLDGMTLKVYPTEPVVLDTLPAVALRFDGFDRRGIDDGEIEIGVTFWDLTWEVVVEVPMAEADHGQRGMHAVLAQVIDALDDSPDLGRADVDDAVLRSGQQFYLTDAQPPRVRVECVLEVRAKST